MVCNHQRVTTTGDFPNHLENHSCHSDIKVRRPADHLQLPPNQYPTYDLQGCREIQIRAAFSFLNIGPFTLRPMQFGQLLLVREGQSHGKQGGLVGAVFLDLHNLSHCLQAPLLCGDEASAAVIWYSNLCIYCISVSLFCFFLQIVLIVQCWAIWMHFLFIWIHINIQTYKYF